MRAFDQIQKPVWFGGLAGLIPFYAGVYGISNLGWPPWSFVGYAWLILAFLCGAIWRAVMENGAGAGAILGLALALGLPALLWLSFWLPLPLQLWLTALGFVAVYLWERAYSWHAYPTGYRTLRTALTAAVLLAHVLLGV
jgi:hypothetical protein